MAFTAHKPTSNLVLVLLIVGLTSFLDAAQNISSLSQSILITSIRPERNLAASTAFKLGISPEDTDTPYIAYATFSDSEAHKSNFGQLFVLTNGDFEDEVQGFGAGFAEGYLSAERIYQHTYNMACQVDCSGKPPAEVEQFFKKQDAWIRHMIAENADTDDMWKFVNFLVNQLDGIMAGYAASDFGRANPMDPWLFTMVNALGDLFDIMPATATDTTSSKRPDFTAMTHSEMRDYMNKNGHCSALIRVMDDMSDIYVGHSSWFVYSAMLRIYKTYSFNLKNKSKQATTISFSSYPGTLSSLDDLYMMAESQLIMTQTTNNIFNASLWDLVQPQSLLAWHRVRSANQLAASGPEWFDIVSRYNGGTYNNQYMILDGKLFKPDNALQDNTLFVVEQIPGLVVGKDVTAELERGYWPSFNVPYHREIYEASGYLIVDAAAGALPYSEYQMAPRAEIFRRDQGTVSDIDTMCTLMRSNDYDTDPLFENVTPADPWNAICARGDLSQPSPSAGGGYDTKVTSLSMLQPTSSRDLPYPSAAAAIAAGVEAAAGISTEQQQQQQQQQEEEKKVVGSVLRARIINGPTAQGQSAFVWSQSGDLEASSRHMGQPDTFDFEFEDVSVPFISQ